MPFKIEGQAYLDTQGWINGLRQMEAMSARTGTRIAGALSGTTAGYSRAGTGINAGLHSGRGGVIGEAVVLMREVGRGNYSRIPGSLSILTQRMGVLAYLVKDNVAAGLEHAAVLEKEALRASNLAKWTQEEATAMRLAYEADGTATVISLSAVDAKESEAVATRVLAERKIEEAKASEAAALAQKSSISVLGLVAIAAVALGVALYFIIRHYTRIAAAAAELRRIGDLTPTFANQTDALKKAADMAEKYRENIEALRQSQDKLAESLKYEMKLFKERQHLELELAKTQGKSGQALLAMEMEQLKAEKALAEAQQAKIQAKLYVQQNDADNALMATQVTAPKEKLEAAETNLKQLQERQKTVMAQLESNAEYQSLIALKKAGGGNQLAVHGHFETSFKTGQPQLEYVEPKTVNQEIQRFLEKEFNVEEGKETLTFTMAQLSKAYADLLPTVLKLREAQKKLDKLVEDNAKGLKVTTDELANAKNAVKELSDAIDLKGEFGPQIAAAQGMKGGGGRGGDSLVRTGNFLGTSRTQIDSLAMEHIKLARQANRHLSDISRNTSHSFSGDNFSVP